MLLMANGEAPAGAKRTRSQNPLKPKTIRNVLGSLSAMYCHAQRKRWVTFNPVQEIELPDVEGSEEIHFLTPPEVLAAARTAQSGRFEDLDRALYITAAMTGLRQGELVALRWRDIDWTAARVRVRQNYVLKEFGTPKSKRSTRSVPMADVVAAALEQLSQASVFSGDDDLVFGDPDTNEPISKADVLARFRRSRRA
jgi:integrase